MELDQKSESLLRFRKALKAHDWYFEMADDGRVHRRGMESHQALCNAASNLAKSGFDAKLIDEIWNAYAPKDFKR